MMRSGRSRWAWIGLALMLGGCSAAENYIESINPFIKREPPIPGLRQPILANDPALQAPTSGVRILAISSAAPRNDWLNPGGPANNAPGNVAIPSGNTQIWRVAGGKEEDRVSSPPILAGGLLIIYDNRRVIAFSASNGALAWTAETFGEETDTPVAGGGITSDGTRVYVATGNRRLLALDLQTGSQIWANALTEPARSAPTIAGNQIYVVTAGSVVYALSAVNGQEIWRYSGIPETGGLLSSSSSAIVGNQVIVPFASGEVVGLDTASGALKWSGWLSRALRTASLSTLADIAGRPVADRGLIIAGSVSGRTLAVKEGTGERVWERNIGTAHTPAVSGEGVFLVSLQGDAYGLDRATGVVRWTSKLPSGKGREVWAGPTLAGGSLWVASNKGQLVGLDARSGEITSRRELGTEAGVILSPLAAGGRLFVVTARGGAIAFE